MAKLNLVQQGAELAYLLLHDPEFRSRVRKEHLYEVGKRIRLKKNIELLYQILENKIDGFQFDFYVLSAAPVEVIHSALEGIGQLTQVIELVKQHLSPQLYILGVRITMFDGRTNLATQVVQEVEKFFPGLIFATRVPRSVRLSETPSFGAAIVDFDPKGKGAAAYTALAEEVMKRE